MSSQVIFKLKNVKQKQIACVRRQTYILVYKLFWQQVAQSSMTYGHFPVSEAIGIYCHVQVLKRRQQGNIYPLP